MARAAGTAFPLPFGEEKSSVLVAAVVRIGANPEERQRHYRSNSLQSKSDLASRYRASSVASSCASSSWGFGEKAGMNKIAGFVGQSWVGIGIRLREGIEKLCGPVSGN